MDEPARSKDRLDLEYINSLPQPFQAHILGGGEWPVQDIDVQTGLVRIDVCGLLQVIHVTDTQYFRDADGNDHAPDDFYLEARKRGE